MLTILLTFLFMVQGPSGKSMSSECCATKKVGEFSYTLIKTTGQLPPQCENSCTYTRDSEEGSRYCFAIGNLPVFCTEETEDTEDLHSICLPGDESCPAYENLMISGLPYNQTFTDCANYCNYLCP